MVEAVTLVYTGRVTFGLDNKIFFGLKQQENKFNNKFRRGGTVSI